MYERTHVHQILLPSLGDLDAKPPGMLQTLQLQWANHPRFLLFKIMMVSLGASLLIVNSSTSAFHHTDKVECFQDVTQDMVMSITDYLKENKSVMHALIITASFLMDVILTLLYLRWVFYGKSVRVAITVAMFYVSRGLTQNVFAMTFPKNYIFEDPGFFSIAVPYFKTNDFFFSGHIGICTVIFHEFKKDKSVFLTTIASLALVINFAMMLVTEGHFIIDLAVGVVVGHYVHVIGMGIESNVKKSENDCLEMFRVPENDEDIEAGHDDRGHNRVRQER